MEKDLEKKMDVLLIDPPWYRFFGQQYSFRPIGLCYLASTLEKNGFQAKVYNADIKRGAHPIDAWTTTKNFEKYLEAVDNINHPIWKEIEQIIRHFRPQIVGITMLTPKYRSALTLARLAKKINPETKVVAGGIHPTSMPNQTINNEQIDFIVKGEGEYTLLELMQAIFKNSPLDKIKGIAFKDNGKIIHNPPRELIESLNHLPHPGNHLIVNKKEMLADDFSRLFASRGCPYQCIFCASDKIWSKSVRYRTPENIIEEIRLIQDEYHPTYFHFEDDSFSLKESFVHQICDLILSRGMNFHWGCETRVNLVTDPLIKKMRQAGCRKIVLGAESGSELTLRKIKKDITLDQIRNAVDICKKNRMETSVFFIIGFPWETESEINQTISFMEELDPQFAVYSIATPYPGTELFEICKREGLLTKNLDWSKFFHQSPEMFLTHKLSKTKINDIISETEKKFIRHNRKKQRQKLFNPYKLFLELKEYYRSPQELLARIRHVITYR